jgi:hypothetical protein
MREYGIEYSWRDGMYVISLPAESADDAMERIRAAASRGRCYTPEGIEATIPAFAGAGLIARALVWVRNVFGGKTNGG